MQCLVNQPVLTLLWESRYRQSPVAVGSEALSTALTRGHMDKGGGNRAPLWFHQPR